LTRLSNSAIIKFLCPGDGIGIRVGLRSQILGVRVSSGAPRNIMEEDIDFFEFAELMQKYEQALEWSRIFYRTKTRTSRRR
jgi:hypothetical protein